MRFDPGKVVFTTVFRMASSPGHRSLFPLNEVSGVKKQL